MRRGADPSERLHGDAGLTSIVAGQRSMNLSDQVGDRFGRAGTDRTVHFESRMTDLKNVTG